MGWERSQSRMAGAKRPAAALSGALALGVFGLMVTGCGMPGAPQPPSLHLPEPVSGLSASRAGDEVTLSWTMPKRNTDKILLKDPIQARICRRESAEGGCAPAGSVKFAPGADARFSETLPTALDSGAPRALTYYVELVNAKGRSAGPSNGAEVPAGAAPAAVEGLHAQMRREGVLLEWTPAAQDGLTEVRLVRTLLTPPAKKEETRGANPLAAPPEAVEQNLMVAAGGPGGALDKDIRFGESYVYRAQRVAEVTVGAEKLEPQKLELAGPLSAPVRIDAVQEFPPAVPTGLAAVATAAQEGAPAAIDLSWQSNTDTDLAGYAVYRCELTAARECGAWERISGEQPVAGPGFHDANVAPGYTYAYAVSAIDQEGHESARSAEAQETVPNSQLGP